MIRGALSAAVPTKLVRPEWKIGLALVALAAVLALGIGLPVSTLLNPPPVPPGDAATDDGLVPLVPGALGDPNGRPDRDPGSTDSGGSRDRGPVGRLADNRAPGAAVPVSAPPIGVGTPAVPPLSVEPSSASSTPEPTPAPTPKPVRLTASYSAVAQADPLGAPEYLVHVTIRNPSDITVSGWRVRFRVPDGELVTSASGARYRQEGTLISFAPAGNATLPGYGTVEFTFTLGGVVTGPPTGCMIDGRLCF